MRSKDLHIKRRKRKREKEIRLIIDEISDFISIIPERHPLKILEFGSGAGYQTQQLKKLGDVTATDIYTGENIIKIKDINFLQTSILNTQFKNGEFDLLFSNHVIEHIKDVSTAFKELKRIGKDTSLYAFSVPTNIWLLLSIPAQYYYKLKSILKKILSRETYPKSQNINNKGKDISKQKKDSSNKLYKIVFPQGHGEMCSGFVDCYKHFRIKNWKHLFEENGFSILRIKPLLIYGPTELPIIPTMKAKKKICSSVLFLMKKRMSFPSL